MKDKHYVDLKYRCSSMKEHNGEDFIECRPGVVVWDDWFIIWLLSGSKISGPRRPNPCCDPMQISCHDDYEFCVQEGK